MIYFISWTYKFYIIKVCEGAEDQGAGGVVVNLYDYHLQGSGSSPLPGELRTPVTLAFGQPSRIGIKLRCFTLS